MRLSVTRRFWLALGPVVKTYQAEPENHKQKLKTTRNKNSKAYMTSWPLNARTKGKNKICSVKVYGTPWTMMHNLCAKKKRKPLLLKQMLRSHFTLSLAYDVQLYESHLTSQHSLYFEPIRTFCIQWEGLRKIRIFVFNKGLGLV